MKQWMCLVFVITGFVSVTAGEALAEPQDRVPRYPMLLHDRGNDPSPRTGRLSRQPRRVLQQFQPAQRLPATGRSDQSTRIVIAQTSLIRPAQETQQSPEPPTPPMPAGAEALRPPLVVTTLQYRPPRRGAPETRVAAASRANGGNFSLAVLVPSDHTGLTIQAHPTLYWYISAPTTHRVDLTIIDEQSVQPLLDITLLSPVQAGIQAIRLSNYKIQLQPGIAYQWAVAVSPDPERRSHDIVASGTIQRVELEGTLRDKLALANQGEKPAIYADAGLWYDALAGISDLVERTPEEAACRSQQANLLKQADLSDIISASPEE
jgi:hypothetical protein